MSKTESIPRVCPGCGAERYSTWQDGVSRVILAHRLDCPVVAHEERYDPEEM